jgi:hypothetical protein
MTPRRPGSRGAVDAALRATGIDVSRLERPDMTSALSRLARVLRERRARTIGLAPADDDVAIPALAIGLAGSLSAGCTGPVAVVDACGSWPCARELADPRDPRDAPASVSWVLGQVAILTPRSVRAGEVATRLSDLMKGGASPFENVVVDLTGVDHLGEDGAAFRMLDGSAIVARSGRTTSSRIARRLRELPPDRSLGVLLTGT